MGTTAGEYLATAGDQRRCGFAAPVTMSACPFVPAAEARQSVAMAPALTTLRRKYGISTVGSIRQGVRLGCIIRVDRQLRVEAISWTAQQVTGESARD